MPKKKGKGKKKVKKKSKSEDVGPSVVGKVSNKTMVQQMASVSLSPVPVRKATTQEKLTQALEDAELRKQQRFMGGISAKAYEKLTPQEIRDLKVVFDTFDTDRSGSIDASELRKAMRALGFKISRSSIQSMIRDLDADESGKIEFNEFLDFVVSRQGDGRDVHDEILQGFKMFDTDKTGHITFDNLKNVSRLCGVNLNEQELKEMMQEADKDGDNQIDREEFVNIMLKTNLFP
ncbi:caltractin [Exaiptasia diaphana]|uniref:EF-hand domain-containing protein n=1 Tax=Exaiptasia diaphana TaxID=2652724 RepID=A0A913YKL3_EXADI|nr:caltractin [Exaiptasia diaphana]